jgi:hypothetical protein
METNKEIFFIPEISKKTREITFKGLKGGSTDETTVNWSQGDWSDNGIGWEQQNQLLGTGHIHFEGFTEDVKTNLMTADQLLSKFNTPTNTLYGQSYLGSRLDYKSGLHNPNLYSSESRDAVLFIGSPMGITIYGSQTPLSKETKMYYNWFKKPITKKLD